MRVAIDGTYFGVLPGLDTERLVKLVKDAGADGMNWPYHADFGADDPTEVRRQLDAAGLVPVTMGLTDHSIAVPGGEAAYQEYVPKALVAALALGVRVLDVWPRRMPEVEKATAKAAMLSNLQALSPKLREAGVMMGIEFEPDHTVERYFEAVEVLGPLHPAVGLTADTYHIKRIGDDLVEAAKAIAPYAAVLHISGSHRGEPGSEGDLCDHGAFIKAAVDAGYKGDVVLQYQAKGDAAESLKRAVEYVRGLV